METEASIPIDKCKFSHFPQGLVSNFTFKFFSTCYCSDRNVTKDFNMTNFYTDTYTSYIYVTLSYKKNILANSTLYNKYTDYLKKTSPRAILYFVDTNFNTEDKFNTKNYFFNYHSLYVNSGQYSKTELYFNLVNLNFDDSIFWAGNFLLIFRLN